MVRQIIHLGWKSLNSDAWMFVRSIPAQSNITKIVKLNKEHKRTDVFRGDGLWWLYCNQWRLPALNFRTFTCVRIFLACSMSVLYKCSTSAAQDVFVFSDLGPFLGPIAKAHRGLTLRNNGCRWFLPLPRLDHTLQWNYTLLAETWKGKRWFKVKVEGNFNAYGSRGTVCYIGSLESNMEFDHRPQKQRSVANHKFSSATWIGRTESSMPVVFNWYHFGFYAAFGKWGLAPL